MTQALASNPPVAEPSRQPGQGTGTFESPAGKRFVVLEGTVIETLLINRLNGTFSGPVNCLVTNDVYSHDRQHILIPAGAKLLGETKKVEALGQQRLAVFFHRMIMPDGFSVGLDEFKGLNQIGETALRDKVNNHYLQIFGASLAIGILGGSQKPEPATPSAIRRLTRRAPVSGQVWPIPRCKSSIVSKYPAMVTIREGNRVKVYLSADLLLPDYAQHTLQPDL